MKKKKILKFALISLLAAITIIIINPTRSTAQTNTVNISRATWDTGWFQTEVVKQLLEKLDYQVSQPQTKDNLNFYSELAKGKTDLWVNGWFPQHEQYLELEGIAGKVTRVGQLVKEGAIQGYLIDKKTADRFQIKDITGLKEPKIAKQFDRNGNGKADLIGCNKDWLCAEIIDYQIKEYGFEKTVEQIKGEYTIEAREAIDLYRQGKPILFYSWTPNWTIDLAKPGEDLVWLEVPNLALPERFLTRKNISVSELNGCASKPCKLGFPVNDIEAVANKKFLDNNPGVKKILELIEIPLADINNANAQFITGETDETDLNRYAKQWLENNRDKVDLWLKLARDEKIDSTNLAVEKTDTANLPATNDPSPTLKVATKRFEPFVMYEDGKYVGFSIDLWEQLALEIGTKYELYGVSSIAKLLDEVRINNADLAIAGITMAAQREETLDFSHPFYETGLQIMVGNDRPSLLETIGASLRKTVTSKELYYGLGIFIVILAAIAHAIWWFERGKNPEFPESYLQGIWESLWWVAVTLTTVGYGDKTPKTAKGRVVGLFWMLAGYFVFAYFTATITTTFAVEQLEGRINGLQDLDRAVVGTVSESAAKEFLAAKNIYLVEYNSIEEAYLALQDKEIEAIVYDSGALQYYSSHQGQGKVKLVGSPFQKQYYGIALPLDSPYRDKLNVALLKIQENGTYNKIYQKWFGD